MKTLADLRPVYVAGIGDSRAYRLRDGRIEQLTKDHSLADALGEAGTISMAMPMRPELERGAGSGQYHGGPIASLIDTVGDFAVVMVTGGSIPTINFRVDYLRPSIGSLLVGKALIRRAGRTVAVVDVDVFDEQGRLTAVGRGCYAIPTS